MIHKIWVLDIKIKGCWIPSRLFIGGNPIKTDFVLFFVENFNFDINNLRIRCIYCIEDFRQCIFAVSPDNPERCVRFKNPEQFIQLAPNIKEGDEIHFDTEVLVRKNSKWVIKIDD